MNWRFVFTSLVLPLKNADSATAQAASLFWNNLARHLAIRDSAKTQLLQAVIAAYGSPWDKAVINHLMPNRINDIISRCDLIPPFPRCNTTD